MKKPPDPHSFPFLPHGFLSSSSLFPPWGCPCCDSTSPPPFFLPRIGLTWPFSSSEAAWVEYGDFAAPSLQIWSERTSHAVFISAAPMIVLSVPAICLKNAVSFLKREMGICMAYMGVHPSLTVATSSWWCTNWTAWVSPDLNPSDGSLFWSCHDPWSSIVMYLSMISLSSSSPIMVGLRAYQISGFEVWFSPVHEVSKYGFTPLFFT